MLVCAFVVNGVWVSVSKFEDVKNIHMAVTMLNLIIQASCMFALRTTSPTLPLVYKANILYSFQGVCACLCDFIEDGDWVLVGVSAKT